MIFFQCLELVVLWISIWDKLICAQRRNLIIFPLKYWFATGDGVISPWIRTSHKGSWYITLTIYPQMQYMAPVVHWPLIPKQWEVQREREICHWGQWQNSEVTLVVPGSHSQSTQVKYTLRPRRRKYLRTFWGGGGNSKYGLQTVLC